MKTYILYDTLLLGVGLYAQRRGERPEWLGVLVMVAGTLATVALGMRHWASIEAGVAAIDFLVMLGFFWLAWRTGRFWPLWCFGFVIADLAVLLARPLLNHVAPVAYATASIVWSYFCLLALALGTRFEARRDRGVAAVAAPPG